MTELLDRDIRIYLPIEEVMEKGKLRFELDNHSNGYSDMTVYLEHTKKGLSGVYLNYLTTLFGVKTEQAIALQNTANNKGKGTVLKLIVDNTVEEGEPLGAA